MHARSRMRSSVSSRVGSTSRRTFATASRASRSSASPTVPARRRASGFARGISAAELSFPHGRITVNLAPAELRKEGSGFDLPIALALLAASQQLPRSALERTAAVGELALDGRLRRVGGVLAVAEGARRLGVERLLCPADSAREAALAGVAAIPIRHLAEAVAYLRGELELEPEPPLAPNGHGSAARARSRRRARPGTRAARARAGRGGWAQPPPRRPARHGEDDARAPAAGDPAAARLRRRARGDADPLGRRSRGQRRSRSSRGRRSARRITAPRPPRSSAAGRTCGRARRASRTAASCSSTSSPSSSGRRSKRCASRSRTASSRSRAPPAGSSSRLGSSWSGR